MVTAPVGTCDIQVLSELSSSASMLQSESYSDHTLNCQSLANELNNSYLRLHYSCGYFFCPDAG